MLQQDKKFYKKILAIAIPITFQGLISSALNMIDTVMIGNLGETPVSAVGLANKVFFVFCLLTFGIVSGSAILTAQFWGKKDVTNIRRVLGISLILGLAGSLIFTIGGLFFPHFVMRIFTPNPETIELGSQYLRVIALSYPITAITMSYVFTLRGVNKVKLAASVTAISILVNTFFNYILIYGNFGAPALGVKGAAIATLIARIFECTVLLTIIYRDGEVAAAKFSEMFDISKDFINNYLRTVAPVIANEFTWGLGVTMYSLVYGRMGDSVVATITITQTLEQLVVVLFQGLSSATAVILGNEIGANKKEQAYDHAKKLIKLSLIMSIVLGVLVVLTRGLTGLIFNVSQEVINDIKICLLVFACYLPVKMFNFINVVGILRSGGDTKFTFLLDFIGVWLIGVPMAVLGGLILHLPIPIVYAMVMSEEILKLILGIKRTLAKKWLNNVVDDIA